MLLIFIFLLIIIFSIGLIITRFDIISPANLYLATWLLSASLGIFLENIWGVNVSFTSVIVLFTCICLFCFPIFILSRTNHFNEKISLLPTISYIKVFLILLYLIFSYFWINNILLSAATELGYDPESHPMSLIQFMRYATTHSDEYEVNMGRMFPNLLRVNFAIGCITFYVFVVNISNKGFFFKKFLLVLVSLIALYISILSTGRTMILSMIIAYLIIYLLESGRVAWNDKNKMRKLIYVLLGVLVLSLVSFILVGIFVLNRFGDGGVEQIFSNISVYLSSALVSFSIGIENIHWYPVARFGEYTFNSFYGTLKSIGLIDNFISPFLLGINVDGWNSNIYTNNFKYILDFGYSGAFILNLGLGCLIGWIYRKIKVDKLNNFILVSFYSIIMYGILMSFFDEQFFLNLNNFIIRWIYAVILFYILVSKSKEKITVK